MRASRGRAAAVAIAVAAALGTPAAVAVAEEPVVEFSRRDRARETTIAIDVARTAGFEIPAALFGTFHENIWDATYGGLWAQLLHAPSFEPDYLSAQNLLDTTRYGRLVTDPPFANGFVRVEPLVEDPVAGRLVRSSAQGLPLPWEALRDAGMRYEPRHGDATNGARSLLVMGLPEREIGIRQGVYLPVHRTRRYRGSLWARRVSGTGPLVASFRRRDRADDVLARVALPIEPRQWTRFEFELELPEGAVAPLEKIDFALAVQGEQRLLLDNVLLWPSDHVEGFDPEIVEAARALRTPVLRWAGNFSSGYHWRDGVGDPERRPTLLNQAWGLPEYNHFGTDEFLRFCRLIGAEPHIGLNAGSGEPEEAAAWVEYVNGSAESHHGALRARNGRHEPYGVRLWEVGNELWGDFQIGYQTPETNARRFVEFAQAVRRVDPGVKLLATGGDVDFFGPWHAELVRQAPGEFDWVSTHLVIGMAPSEQVRRNASDAFTHAADLAVPVGTGRKLDEMRAQLATEPRTRDRARIAFSEWLFWSPRPRDPRFTNVGGAIVSAGFFQALLARGDFVTQSNMSNLVHFAGIHRQRGRVFVTPSYHVFRLYSDARGGRPVRIRVEGPGYDVREGNRRLPEIPDVPYVDALAVAGADGALRVYLVNRHLTRALPVRWRLAGFSPAPEATLRRVTSRRLAEANTPEEPERVRLEESRLAVSAETAITLPPLSASVIELRPAAGGARP